MACREQRPEREAERTSVRRTSGLADVDARGIGLEVVVRLVDVDGEVAGEQLVDRGRDDGGGVPFRTFSSGYFGCGVRSSQVPGWMCAGMSGLPAGSTVTSTAVLSPTVAERDGPGHPGVVQRLQGDRAGARPAVAAGSDEDRGSRRSGRRSRPERCGAAGGVRNGWACGYLVCGWLVMAGWLVRGPFGGAIGRPRRSTVATACARIRLGVGPVAVATERGVAKLVGTHRAREQVALAALRTEAAQDVALLGRLDALGDGVEPQRRAEVEDRADERARVARCRRGWRRTTGRS